MSDVERFRLARFPTPAMERELGSPRLARLVRRWHGFGTPQELLARVDEGLSSDERNRVRATLARFLEQRMLVSERELLAAVARGDIGGPTEPIAALVVPTRGAAGSLAVLARGLESHLCDRAASGGTHAIVVFDDRREQGDGRALRGVIGDADVRHVGAAEKRAFAAALVHELADEVPAQLVQFALFGSADVDFRAGANRNCALLMHAGQRIVSVDDDAVCRISAIPGASARLRLSSAPDPTEFWCFSDRGAVLSATADDRADLVGLHASMLGHDLASCVHGRDPVELDGMSPRFTERVLATRCRVAATYVGVAGDSGMASPAFALLQGGASRQRIMAGPTTYECALRSREVVRGVTSPTLVDSGFFMGLAVGLDHRELLPPFLPVGRNEDHVFGLVLAHACADAVVGCLPFALLHAPAQSRAFAPADLRFRETKLADLLRACIHGLPAAGIELDRAAGLRALGRQLVELASRPLPELAEELRRCRAQVARATMAFLEVLVRRHGGAPQPWVRDVERYVATCEAAANDPSPIVADELAMHTEGAERTREQLARFGELLAAWPTIVAAARRLRG